MIDAYPRNRINSLAHEPSYAESEEGLAEEGCFRCPVLAQPIRVGQSLALDPELAIRILKVELGAAQLRRQNEDLLRRVTDLEDGPQPLLVPINTFAPQPFEPIKQILVVVEPVVDDSGEPCEYVATFPDGYVGASGNTVEEAVSHLKDRMLTKYDMLANMPTEQLGRIPKRQLATLQSIIRRVG
jgi:hypothetical protein